MNGKYRNVLIVLGALAALYLFVVYLLPVLLMIMGAVLVIAFKILLFVAVLVGLYVILRFLITNLKKT